MEKSLEAKRKKEIQDQVEDIVMRVEYIAEKEPAILNYIQRTIEGLSIIDNDVIKLENSTKLLTMKVISKLKNEEDIKGLLKIAHIFNKAEENR